MSPAAFPWLDYSRYAFSLGVDVGSTAFLSGQAASEYDPDEKRITVKGGLDQQTRIAYAKIAAILESGGYGQSDIVSVVEYVTAQAIEGYHDVKQIRRDLLGEGIPICTVCVKRLVRPGALIEIEVVASRGGTHGDNHDGLVFMPSCWPPETHDPVAGRDDFAIQVEGAFDQVDNLLAGAGLSWSNVVKIVEYIHPAVIAAYPALERVRRRRLGPAHPSTITVVMPCLAHPAAQIQLDVVASRNPVQAVDLGQIAEHIGTHRAAVKAGNVVFVSGQALIDQAARPAMYVDEVAAQAESAYTSIVAAVEAAGGSVQHITKLVEYVTPVGLTRYRETAAVRSRLFRHPLPASTGVICERLLEPAACIEIDAVALL